MNHDVDHSKQNVVYIAARSQVCVVSVRTKDVTNKTNRMIRKRDAYNTYQFCSFLPKSLATQTQYDFEHIRSDVLQSDQVRENHCEVAGNCYRQVPA